MQYTAIIRKEDSQYVSWCSELDIASQGDTVEEAKINLAEAIQLFIESASEDEKQRRLKSEVYISTITA